MIDHRPIAHLQPASGWTNDPIGPVHWRGRTHLFSQVNPDGPYWARPHWGHFVTDDLVHWQRRPIALSPDPDGPDADGCYSGCVVVIDDVATMFYTGARRMADGEHQTTCIARSDDDELDRWVKDPANPVVRAPGDVATDAFRDPFVYQDGDRWIQLIGAALPGVGGAVLAYASTDLRSWEALPPLLTSADLPGDTWTGNMWECPALLRSEEGDALLVSVHDGAATPHHTVAITGTLTGTSFRAEQVQPFDHGPDLYAPCLHTVPDGRTLAWGWSWEARSEERVRESGWAGLLTVPRTVRVADGSLFVAPAPEVVGLRERPCRFSAEPTSDGWLAAGVHGTSLDIELTVPPGHGAVELRVLRSPDLAERSTIGIDRATATLWVDRDASSLDDHVRRGRYTAPVSSGNEPTQVRVLIDRSILEVFVDDRVALTTRVYPSRADSTGVEVVGVDPDEAQGALRVWELGSVWLPEEGPLRTSPPVP